MRDTMIVTYRVFCQFVSLELDFDIRILLTTQNELENVPLFSVFQESLSKSAAIQTLISWVPLTEGLSQECSYWVSHVCSPPRPDWGENLLPSSFTLLLADLRRSLFSLITWPLVSLRSLLETSLPCHMGLSKEELTTQQVASLRVNE